MVRTPCCEKMGLKKGPWTPEEDQILISYIQNYGHGNWRALPKQAGLLRCGKSCRLRWINYLRPDIKRGKFSNEEEEIIIKLHQILGNRWSAIAARLPGRTDNEIKNFWHTHLKKRLERCVVHNVDAYSASSSYTLQEVSSSSSRPQAKDASSSASAYGFTNANDTSVIQSAVSCDTTGETLGSRNSSKLSEEMEFWYNLFMKAGQGQSSQGH